MRSIAEIQTMTEYCNDSIAHADGHWQYDGGELHKSQFRWVGMLAKSGSLCYTQTTCIFRSMRKGGEQEMDFRIMGEHSMKQTKHSSSLQWLGSRLRGQSGRMVFLIVTNAVAAVTSVGYALACKGIVDAAVGGDARSIGLYIGLIIALVVADVALTVARKAMAEYVSTRLHLHLQEHILSQLTSRKFSAVTGYHSGELLNRLFSDVNVVAGGVTNILPSAAYMVSRLIASAATLLVLAPAFALLFLVVGVGIFLAMTLLRPKIKRLHKELQSAQGGMRSFMQEMLERLLVIKVFGAFGHVQTRLQGLQEGYARARMRSHAMGIAANTGFALIFDLGHFLALVWGCFGILNHSLSYGTLTAMMQLVGQVQQPFSSFSALLSQVFTVTASAERLIELEKLPGEAAQEPLLYENLSAIAFDHVDFTYGRTDVLQDVCLKIRKGDVLSITGISGGGKSTLFLLILGAYQPQRGQVRFEQGNAVCPPGDATRGLCAYVPQGNYLMSGTLRDNLTFFRSDIPEVQIWQALEDACASEFVRGLPQGLDTVLGEKGHGLSEGQMQRVAIARALLSGAPVLLLDEATSALDEATEAQLLRSIASMKDRTILIVTHRRSALQICNRHLLIRDSRISEAGLEEIDNL